MVKFGQTSKSKIGNNLASITVGIRKKILNGVFLVKDLMVEDFDGYFHNLYVSDKYNVFYICDPVGKYSNKFTLFIALKT